MGSRTPSIGDRVRDLVEQLGEWFDGLLPQPVPVPVPVPVRPRR